MTSVNSGNYVENIPNDYTEAQLVLLQLQLQLLLLLRDFRFVKAAKRCLCLILLAEDIMPLICQQLSVAITFRVK